MTVKTNVSSQYYCKTDGVSGAGGSKHEDHSLI